MADLKITEWINDLNEEIHVARQAIRLLNRLGKFDWAEQLAEEVKIMHDSIKALEHIGQQQHKRLGRPPLWLHAMHKANHLQASHTKHKHTAKQATANPSTDKEFPHTGDTMS
jgi:hypothetical protein